MFFSVEKKDTNWETSNGILSKILLQVGDHGKTTHFLYDYFDDFQKCSTLAMVKEEWLVGKIAN